MFCNRCRPKHFYSEKWFQVIMGQEHETKLRGLFGYGTCKKKRRTWKIRDQRVDGRCLAGTLVAEVKNSGGHTRHTKDGIGE